MYEQLELNPKDGTAWQQFCLWKELPGANHVLRLVYREFARHVPLARRTGTSIGVKMVVEVVRHSPGQSADGLQLLPLRQGPGRCRRLGGLPEDQHLAQRRAVRWP